MLNNHGWGLREMLFICAGIILCVLFVAAMVNNLYSEITPATGGETSRPSTSTNTYEKVEKRLESAAKLYHRRHEEIGNLIISDDLLDEKYLTTEDLTVNNDFCSGYVIVENNVYTPYISCENYETEGY